MQMQTQRLESKLEILTLGTSRSWHAVYEGVASSSFVVRNQKTKDPILLIECGYGVAKECVKHCRNIPKYIYISHHSPGQVGELPVVVSREFHKKKRRTNIICHSEIAELLRSSQLNYIGYDSFYEFTPLSEGNRHQICEDLVENLEIELIRTLHTNPSYGFIMYHHNVPVLSYSGDGAFTPEVYEKLSIARTILFDAKQVGGKDHASFKDVRKFQKSLTKHQRAFVYHYGKFVDVPMSETHGVQGILPGQVLYL